jgi:hypothetical protein
MGETCTTMLVVDRAGDGDSVLVWRGCHAALRPMAQISPVEVVNDALIEAID